MLKVYCSPSPFVFKPIVQLSNAVDYKPKSTYEYLCLCIIDPMNEKYRAFKEKSHMTEAQAREGQIRYLGPPEVDRRLMYLASQLVPCIQGEALTFVVEKHLKDVNYLYQFIKCLQLQGMKTLHLEFTREEVEVRYSCEESKLVEELYFSDEQNRKDNAKVFLEASKTCLNSGDYYSAVNLLASLVDLDIEDKILEVDIYLHLALCYRLIGSTSQAAFYYNLCLTSPELRQRNSAYYALSMIYLRHYHSKHQSVAKGIEYLEKGYQELLRAKDDHKIQVDRVFNRNGFALALFQTGDIKASQNLVEQGISHLDRIDTYYSKFHQTILYYNLFQCLVKQQDYNRAAQAMQHLISLDSKFFAYYEFLSEFYINIGSLEKAVNTLTKAVEIDETYFKFYYLLGKAKYLQKDYATAIKHFQKAYYINPQDLSSLCYLTTINNLEGKYENNVELLARFNLKYNNNSIGELIFSNKVIALLNTNAGPTVLQELVDKALMLCPTSKIIHKLKQQIKALAACSETT